MWKKGLTAAAALLTMATSFGGTVAIMAGGPPQAAQSRTA